MLKNMMLMTACASREKGQNTMMFFSSKALDKFRTNDDANYDEHAPRIYPDDIYSLELFVNERLETFLWIAGVVAV
jgi:hypothetical protein